MKPKLMIVLVVTLATGSLAFADKPSGSGDVNAGGNTIGTFDMSSNDTVLQFTDDPNQDHPPDTDTTLTYNFGQDMYYSPNSNPAEADTKVEFTYAGKDIEGNKTWSYKKWWRSGSQPNWGEWELVETGTIVNT